MVKFHIGEKVFCKESGVVGFVIKFYTPTSCEEQTLVRSVDGRKYHAPTRTWEAYKYGKKASIQCIDDACTGNTNELGKYVNQYASNHGLSIAQTYEKEMVQAYKEYYNSNLGGILK